MLPGELPCFLFGVVIKVAGYGIMDHDYRLISDRNQTCISIINVTNDPYIPFSVSHAATPIHAFHSSMTYDLGPIHPLRSCRQVLHQYTY